MRTVGKKPNDAKEEGKAAETRIESGYAWRLTLGDFASLSGIFAGFAIAFIVLILALPVETTSLSSDSSKLG